MTAFTHEIDLSEFLKYQITCRGELQICQDYWEDKRIESRINQIVVANTFKSHVVTASHEKLTTSSSWQIFPFAARKKTKKRRTCSANKKESFFLARTIRRSSWTISILSSVIFLKRIEYQKILSSVVGWIVYSLSIDMLDNLPIIKLHSNYVISWPIIVPVFHLN